MESEYVESSKSSAQVTGLPSPLNRAAQAVLSSICGAVFGRFGGWFVWIYIYSIGSRVVTDELYASLRDEVSLCSTVVGGVSGLIVGFFFSNRSVIALFAQHAVGVACGMIAAQFGWQYGLCGYFVGQLMGILIVFSCSNQLPSELA